MKIGIIGSGYIAEEFMKNLNFVSGIEVISAYSRTKEKLDIFCEKYSIKNSSNSVEELLESGVDSIYIASHSNSHYEYTLKAIEKGINVLCEKPVTINSKELKDVLEKSKEKNVVFMEAMRLIYMPSYLKVKELLKGNYFGNIISIETSLGRISSRLYRHTLELAGGSLMDLGIYCIFAIVDILGIPNEIKVEGLKLDTGVDSTIMGIMKYDNAIGSMYCSCISQTRGELRILCERGTITLPELTVSDKVILKDKEGDISFIELNKKSTGMVYEIEEFKNRVAKNDVFNEKEELSLSVMKVMDYIRNQVGVRYPNEI